jgi:O-antigen/teichoic acid export membrane protein
VTSLLGVAFWALAAHTYSAHEVGVNAAAISAMTLVSGLCSLGLSAVLVRYLPIAGTATRKLITASYGLTAALSLAIGAGVALSSNLWSPSLSFLSDPGWVIGFSLATAGTTIFVLQDNVLTGLRSAQWIPIENSLYAGGKLVLLLALPLVLSSAGPFVAWTAPLLPAIVLINYLVYRRLIPAEQSFGSLDRRTVVRMAAGNYGGNLFALAGTLYLPVLVANLASASEAAYFYVPWLFSLSLQLVAINMMTSLTVEAALDLPALRRLARQALKHSLRLVTPLVVLAVAIAPWILLIFGQAYADAGTPLLRWLAVGALPNVIVTLGISVARIEHRGAIVVGFPMAHAVSVIALSALLLPGVGIVAVGIAWTGIQTVLAILMLTTVLRPVLFGNGDDLAIPSPNER